MNVSSKISESEKYHNQKLTQHVVFGSFLSKELVLHDSSLYLQNLTVHTACGKSSVNTYLNRQNKENIRTKNGLVFTNYNF